MTKPEPKHEPVSIRTGGRTLVPAHITPYCPLCRVPWPCPKAAAEAGTLPGLPDLPDDAA